MMTKKLLFFMILILYNKVSAEVDTNVKDVLPHSFLKAKGITIRNNSGKGDIVDLRGTNLGSWLSFEYWMMPLGTGALDRRIWKLIPESSDNKVPAIIDGDMNTAYHFKDDEGMVIDMQRSRLFNSIRLQSPGASKSIDQKIFVDVSSNGIEWENIAERSFDSDMIVKSGILNKRFIKIRPMPNPSVALQISEVNVFMEDDLHVRLSLEQRFGPKKADELLDAFQDSWITMWDLDNIKAMGMNVVRVPFFWRELMFDNGSIKKHGFKQLDWIISECKKREIYVILDMHGAPGGINGYITSGQAVTNEYWNDIRYRIMTKKIWTTIAKRYRSNPTVAMYDVLNEARVPEEKNVPNARDYAEKISFFYNELYQTIRAVDPDHIICFNAFYDLSDILPPKGNGSYNWENVVYEVHYYGEENKKNPENMSKHIDGWLTHMEKFQKNWEVPIYLGEFNCWQDMNNWSKLLDGLNRRHISWTNWSYKTTRIDSSPEENWGYYQGNHSLPSNPDLHTDSFEAIRKKWKQFSTTDLIKNEVLIRTVSNYTHRHRNIVN